MDGSVVEFSTVVGFVDEKKGLVWRPTNLAEQEYVFEGDHKINCSARLAWSEMYDNFIYIHFSPQRSTY